MSTYYRMSMTPLFQTVATHVEIAQRSLELEFPEPRSNDERLKDDAFRVGELFLLERLPRKDVKKWSCEVTPLGSLSRTAQPDATVEGVKVWLI